MTTMTTGVEDTVRSALTGVPDLADLELFDVEVGAGLVRVLLDRPGGVDLDSLASANRVISAALDAADPLPGRYTLEVSSPGLERPLRTPEHFRGHVGATVKVKTRPGTPGDRRLEGRLAAADDTGITLSTSPTGVERRLSYGEIASARTVFTWGPPAGRQGKRRARRGGKAASRS